MPRRSWFALLMVPLMLAACSAEQNSDEADTPTSDASDTQSPEDPEDETSPDPGSEIYWPSTEAWETVTPEEAGADVNKLNEAIEFAESSNSGGMIVLHKGKIVTERYWQGWDQDTTMTIYSATKSMTALLVGMALDDGSFEDVQQPISDFAPQWVDTPKADITLEHFLTMTTGLSTTPPNLDSETTDQFEGLADGLALENTPGTVWEYNTPAYLMMFTMLEKATGENLEDYARRKLFGPLGMQSPEWVKIVVSEDVTNYRRIESNTRDMARFGLFTLRRGVWNNEQLVSEAYFEKATAPYLESKSDYGFLYWLQEVETDSMGTLSAISAIGKDQKLIMAIPDLDLVIVRHGDAAGMGFVGPFTELVAAAFASSDQ